jgi:hypothetical protein
MSGQLRTELRSEAKERGVSLNSLINQILEKHVAFDRIVEQMGGIPLSRLLFTGMLDGVSLEEMERLGKELGPKLVKQAFAFLGLSYDLDNLIKRYFAPLSSFSGWYSFNVSGSGRDRKLLFAHRYGIKWSTFLAQYIGGIIKVAISREPRTDIEDNLVTVYC